MGPIYVTKQLLQAGELDLANFFCGEPGFLNELSHIGIYPEIYGGSMPGFPDHGDKVSFHIQWAGK
jgi:hypothetical protein